MRRAAAFTALLFALATPGHATVFNSTYSFGDFTGHPLSVSRVMVTPQQQGADYNGTNLSSKPLIFTAANYPGLTNGLLTVSNLVAGYSYEIKFSDGYGTPTITNYFPTGLTGTVSGRDYKAVILSQSGNTIFQIAYFYRTNESSIDTNAISGYTATNETRAVNLGNAQNIFVGHLAGFADSASTANFASSAGTSDNVRAAVSNDMHNASNLSAGTLPTAQLPALTGGDVTSSAGSGLTTIANGVVSNAKLANMGAATVKGSVSGGVPADLTASQLVTSVIGSTPVQVATTAPNYVPTNAGFSFSQVLNNALIAGTNRMAATMTNADWLTTRFEGTPDGLEDFLQNGIAGYTQANISNRIAEVIASGANWQCWPAQFFINATEGVYTNRNSDGTLRLNSVDFPNITYLIEWAWSNNIAIGPYEEFRMNTSGGPSFMGGITNIEQDLAQIARDGWTGVRIDSASIAAPHGDDELASYYQRSAAAARSNITNGRPFLIECFPGSFVTNYSKFFSMLPAGTIMLGGQAMSGDWNVGAAGNTFGGWTNFLAFMYRHPLVNARDKWYGGGYYFNNLGTLPMQQSVGSGFSLLGSLIYAGLSGSYDQSTITNKELEEIRGDVLHVTGFYLTTHSNRTQQDVWVKPLANKGLAVWLVNLTTNTTQLVGESWAHLLGLSPSEIPDISIRAVQARTNFTSIPAGGLTNTFVAMSSELYLIKRNPNLSSLRSPIASSSSISSELGGNPLNAGLILDLPFLEGSGSTVTSRAPGADVGTFFGTLQWTNGPFGNAIYSNPNGGNDYLQFSSNVCANLQKITISTWVNTTNDQLVTPVTKSDGSGTEYQIAIWSNAAPPAVFWRVQTITGGSVVISTQLTNIFDRKWHQIVGTYDGSNIRLFVDGLCYAQASQSGTTTNTASHLRVGAIDGGGLGYTRFLNRAASTNEVRMMFNQQYGTQ